MHAMLDSKNKAPPFLLFFLGGDFLGKFYKQGISLVKIGCFPCFFQGKHQNPVLPFLVFFSGDFLGKFYKEFPWLKLGVFPAFSRVFGGFGREGKILGKFGVFLAKNRTIKERKDREGWFWRMCPCTDFFLTCCFCFLLAVWRNLSRRGGGDPDHVF